MDNHRTYSNGEITVFWKPEKCCHSGNCVRGLPEVFDPKCRPWVKIEAAGSKRIIGAVERCPSGALSWEPCRK